MRSSVRERVERNMEYHQNMADFYAQKVKEVEEPPEQEEDMPDATRQRIRLDDAAQQQKEKDHAGNQYLAEMHGEAAKQLRDVLGMTPVTPVIEQAAAQRPFLREDSGMVATISPTADVPRPPRQVPRGGRLLRTQSTRVH